MWVPFLNCLMIHEATSEYPRVTGEDHALLGHRPKIKHSDTAPLTPYVCIILVLLKRLIPADQHTRLAVTLDIQDRVW